MEIVCGKCGLKFVTQPGNPAAEQMKAHPCDVHKYPELQK